MLATDYYPANKQTGSAETLLVFVHGLLGSGGDWSQVINRLDEYDRITIDLPGHGKSTNIAITGFDSVVDMIAVSLEKQLVLAGIDKNTPVALIGYSLGARLLMYGLVQRYFNCFDIVKVLLEGGNFGLHSESDRQKRLVNDQMWANRFATEALDSVLQDWYQQPVFLSLSVKQRAALIEVRAHNDGPGVAELLLSTSLAKQPYLLNRLKNIDVPLHYICGEKDKKFFELAEQSKLSYSVAKGAGHNVHSEVPELFAKLVRDQLGNTMPASLERTNLE